MDRGWHFRLHCFLLLVVGSIIVRLHDPAFIAENHGCPANVRKFSSVPSYKFLFDFLQSAHSYTFFAYLPYPPVEIFITAPIPPNLLIFQTCLLGRFVSCRNSVMRIYNFCSVRSCDHDSSAPVFSTIHHQNPETRARKTKPTCQWSWQATWHVLCSMSLQDARRTGHTTIQPVVSYTLTKFF